MKSFSKVNFPVLRKAKKLYKNNKAQFEAAMHSVIDNEDIEVSERIYTSAVESMILYGYTNYYIETEDLGEFLSTTYVRKDAIPSISKYVKQNGKYFRSQGVTVYNSKDVPIEKSSGINFHALSGCCYTKTFQKAIFFYIYDTGNFASLIVTDGDDYREVPLYGEIEGSKLRWAEDEFIEKIETLKSETKLILNMIFYMDTFPEKVSKEPPNEVTDKLNKDNSLTIKQADQITEYLREVSPHLRRGYFKCLTSEYFTPEKRGSTIFVKATFVKGKGTVIKE